MIDSRRSLIGLVASVVAVGLPWFVAAQDNDDDIELTPVDHSFSVPVGGTLSLTYEVDGTLPPGVVPTTTTTSSTTTTTTAAPETPGGGAGDAPPTPRPPSPTTATTTTTVPDVDTEARVLVYPRLTDTDQVAAVLAGDTDVVGEPDDGLDVDIEDSLNITRSSGNRTVTIDVDVDVADQVTDAPDVGMPDPGIYPVETLLRLDDSTVARHMTLVRREPDHAAATVNLAALGGVLGRGSATTGLRDLTELAELDVPVTAAVPPTLLADVDATAPDLVEDLATALRDDEVVALPDDGLDASSAARADLGDLFTAHLRTGEDVLAQLLPETPVRRSVWPIVEEPPSVDGADLLAGLGVRTFVVSPSVADAYIEPGVGAPDDRDVSVPLPDGDIDAVVVDPEIAALLDDPGGRSPQDVAMELLSVLTMQQGDAGRRIGSVLTTADLGVPDPRVIEALAGLAADTDDVAFSSVSALSSGSSSDATGVLALPESAGVDLQPRVDAVNLTWLELSDTASMLPDNDPRRMGWRDDLEALLSTDVDDDEAQRVIDELQAESDELRSSVVEPDPFTFTMTGRSSDVRVRIANDSDTPLSVRVAATSPKLTFPDGSQIVELEPRATTLVPISVEARSNGTSELVVMIGAPNGDQLTDPVHLTANVRSFTGLSQLVTGGAALILLTWWITHLRRRWLERRLAGEAARHPSRGNQPPAAADGG